MPTSSSLGTGIAAVPLRISDSTPGAILQPQPPPCDSEVRRGSAAVLGRAAFMGWIPVLAGGSGAHGARRRHRTAARAGRIVRRGVQAGGLRGLAVAGPG